MTPGTFGESTEMITLTRACEATLIPYGKKVTLKAGEEVRITQALGDSFTLLIHGNLVRIEGKDADAIGKEPARPSPPRETDHEGPVDEQMVWDAIRTCYDPEIPLNIVDLGLIYSCDFISLEGSGTRVEVKMTLTAPGCGMGGPLAEEVRNKILGVPGVTDVDVDLVWDPPWNQSMISEAARLQLGIL
ncbi:MAG: putative Fe-S cluster assembly protein SufT [Fidelibacterota bacterium]